MHHIIEWPVENKKQGFAHGLDILVNNAGYQKSHLSIMDISEEMEL